MPKLKMVVACERVLVDITGPVSIISIFQRMNIQLQAAPLPPQAVSTSRWHVFSLWENDPKEVGQQFTQILRVFAPDGTLFVEQELSFQNNDVNDFQTKINIMLASLPIWAEGDMFVRVWLKGNEEPAGEFRFAIVYVRQELNAETTNIAAESK